MARTGWGGANFLRHNGAVLTAAPLTLSIRFNMAVAGGTHCLMGLFNSGATFTLNQFSVKQSADAIQATTADGSTFSNAVSSTTTTTTGVWHHACAVFASATDRRAFLNGGGKGTNATSRVPSGIDRTSVGLSDAVSGGQAVLSGTLLAEAAIWNVALTDAEVVMLGAARVSPLLVRPANLVAYWPLIGAYSPEIELKARQEMTVQGTLSAAAHAPAFHPARRRPGRLAFVALPPSPPRLALTGAGS